MIDLAPSLETSLGADGSRWFSSALAAPDLPVLLPQLPRRLGRGPLGGGPAESDGCWIDRDAWRTCDAGAAVLLQRAAVRDEVVVELFRHGDIEEKIMLARSLAARPIGEATLRILGEAQRTNLISVFEAAVCDSNLAQRAVASGRWPLADAHRMILKLAFNDLELARVAGIEACASTELSRMLQDFATEREAAGRSVWADTDLLLARAPIAGTTARILGGLEHGDDRRRLAAVRALALLNRRELAPFVRERLDREPKPAIRALLQSLATGSEPLPTASERHAP